MTSMLDETNPLGTHLVGEADNHIRTLKENVETLFRKGHHLSDTYPTGTSADGQLKFGERVADDYAASGAISLDFDLGTIHVLDLTGDATLTFGDLPDDGATEYEAFGFVLIVRQDATGGRGVTWPGSVKWLNDSTPYLASGANDETHYSFYTIDSGVSWYGAVVGYYV